MPYNGEEPSGSDSDTGFDDDMEALRKACAVTGVDDSVDDLPRPSTADSDYGDTYASEDEDIQLLRSIQQRFSVPTNDIGSEQHPISMKPLSIIMPSGLSDDNDDYGDDFETLRAIQRRFSQYHDSNNNNNKESSVQKPEQVGATNIELERESSPNFFVKRINNQQGFPDCVDGRNTNQNLELSSNISSETPNANVNDSEIITTPDCGFPRSAQAFVEAIKKNRICQKFIRNKLGQIEAKMEENKKLRERVKILKDFQVACRKKTGRALSQKKDPRIQLITVPKLRINAAKDTDMHAINQGPVDNPHVADYRDAMSKYPFALTKEPWSNEEKENLLKGIKQQFQEMLMQNLFSTEDTNYNLDSMLVKIRDHEISHEEIRSFLPKVNWEQLASMYVTNRTGPECQSRWMNVENPLINHESWSLSEDKKLLYTVQNRGLSNWIEIAESLGTNRTPFQCLSRFQRSLNASIIKNEWTPVEDEELRNAVAEYGDTNWQLVASTLEGRTGTQCSNRWNKSLNPMRKRVGKWAPDEDKRLKIAVKLFGGKNWNKIARFVPGRTQVQCRERWVNCLDPALNMNEWTPQEDLQLKYAISEHGYCWSKVAACVPPRTDNQCRRRWSVLLPHEVPVLQRARKMKKAAFISNFVDREEERPALTVNDFIAPLLIESAPEKPKENQRSEPEHCEPESSSGAVVRIRSRRARKVTHTEKTLRLIDEDEDDDVHEDIKGNQSLKNKQKISSQEAELSDLNNHQVTETINVDNSEIKKKATKKRKRRGNKEQESSESLMLDKKTRRPSSRTNRGGALLTTSSGLLDPNNGEKAGDNSQIKLKRKPRGNKEHKKTDETLAPVAILSKKTKRPRSKANRGRHLASVNITEQDAPIDDLNEAILTTEKTVTEIHSSSSPTAAPPPAAGAPPVVAITAIENATSINKTPKKRKRGGNSCNGGRQKRSCIKIENSYGEIGDDETLGSFFSKLKMGDSETIGSFFSKLKKRRFE